MPETTDSFTHSPKLRVLLMGRLYPPTRGSGGRLLRELARSFARDGWEVQVLTTADATSHDPDGTVQVKRLRFDATSPRIGRGITLLWRFLWAALFLPKPQLVITLSDPPLLAVIGWFVAWRRGAAHIHWCQDVYPDLLPVVGVSCPKWLTHVMFWLSRRAMNHAARVVVTGRCMARTLSQSGVEQSKLVLIPNWPELAMNPNIKTGDVRPATIDNNVLGGNASILEPVPKFRVLYIGTVGYAHPVDTILDAATILESVHPEIEFIFIGDTEAHANVTAEKAKRGGLGNVRILPFQPQSRLRDIMESGDLHIISMKHEAAGLMVPAKFYAALAAARPCILVGPEACEIARVIQDYKIGMVVPQKSAQMLAQAIIDYRLREDLWFTAQEGATNAAAAYMPEDMLRLWLKKAREVVG